MGYRPKHFHHTPPRLAKVSHNQFVDRRSYHKPSVASKVVVPESSALHAKHNPLLQRQNSETKKASISNRLHLAPQTVQETVQRNGKQEQCSSLSSTKKRLTQKMSEMSIDRLVGNGRGSSGSENSSVASAASSPTFDMPMQEVASPKVSEFVRICCIFNIFPVFTGLH